MNYQINFGTLAPYEHLFLSGFLMTLELSFAAFAISLPLGMLGALVRTSRRRVLRVVAAAYVEAMRNVPLLVIIYVLFYGLPSAGIQMGAFTAGLVALVLNSNAYMIEIFRGGLKAIAKGQYEASESLGLRPRQYFRYVIFPQLIRTTFPALGNQAIGLVLGSSLISVIGVSELTYVSYKVGSMNFRYFEVFSVAALAYLLASQVIGRTWAFTGGRWLAATRRTVR